MADEISYFEVAGFLAEIEAEYAEISDPIERTQQLIALHLRFAVPILG